MDKFNILKEALFDAIDAILDFIEQYQDAKEELESCEDKSFVKFMTKWYDKFTE